MPTLERMIRTTQINLLEQAGATADAFERWGGTLGKMEEGKEQVSQSKEKMRLGANEVGIVGIISLDETAEIYEWFFGKDFVCSPKKVAAAFAECEGDVLLKIDSYGGYVKGASKICNIINQYAKDNNAKVNGVIEGWSVSAATLIQMQTDRLEIAEFGEVMIHRSSAVAAGNTHDMAKAAKYMAGRDETFAKSYADKSGKDPKEMLKLMDAETWFSANEAVEIGLVDAIAEKRKPMDAAEGGDDDDDSDEKMTAHAVDVVKMLMDAE